MKRVSVKKYGLSERIKPVLFRVKKAVLSAALVASALLLFACGEKTADSVYICNWGEYLADGSEGIFNAIRGFEEYYEGVTGRPIKVYYTTFDSNEDLYAKQKGGASGYDLIFPSDYMVQRMIEEDLLMPIDVAGTCSRLGAECLTDNISEDFRGLYFDPEDKYSVPYTYGRVGIIYNSLYVDPEDIGGWDLMWNDKYAGHILQFNNSRDAFATAQYYLGINVNTEDPADWQKSYELLLAQKPLVQSYVMDEVYNKLESGEAWIAPYYAGDYFTMKEINGDLEFYYPERTNVFVDSMCIPKGAKNKEAAELFINYMLSEEPGVASAEFIYYASPNSAVYESPVYIDDMGEEVLSVLYPENFNFKAELSENAYKNLSPKTLELMGALWEDLKISGGLPMHVYVLAAAIAVFSAGVAIYLGIKRKRRSKWWN